MDLSGQVAVITGGSGGIGLGMAGGVATAGADVALWARDEHKSAAAVEQLRAVAPKRRFSPSHATSPTPIRSKRRWPRR